MNGCTSKRRLLRIFFQPFPLSHQECEANFDSCLGGVTKEGQGEMLCFPTEDNST